MGANRLIATIIYVGPKIDPCGTPFSVCRIVHGCNVVVFDIGHTVDQEVAYEKEYPACN